MLMGIRNRKKNEEGGFTLIELLVVVLILGILMAIAIPTFLSLTSGAKTNAAEADLTTAAQDEATYLALYGDFDNTPANPPVVADNLAGMTATDPGLTWTATASSLTAASAGKKLVYIWMNSTATGVILGTAGQNGNFYWVSDNLGTLTYAYSTISGGAVPPTTTPPFTATSWKAATLIT